MGTVSAETFKLLVLTPMEAEYGEFASDRKNLWYNELKFIPEADLKAGVREVLRTSERRPNLAIVLKAWKEKQKKNEAVSAFAQDAVPLSECEDQLAQVEWKKAADYLRFKLGDAVFKCWLEGCCAKRITSGVLEVLAPTRYKAGYIKNNYGRHLADYIKSQTVIKFIEINPYLEKKAA